MSPSVDLDVDALVQTLGRQIGQQAVQITALQLQLDAARTRVTALEQDQPSELQDPGTTPEG